MAKEKTSPAVKITIPELEPYEGKATLKQKAKIWHLGYQDQSVIDTLGKKQASALIDGLLSAEAKRGVKPAFITAAVMAGIGVICCLVGGFWWIPGIALIIVGGCVSLSGIGGLLR
jgi:hypothetical protein